MRIKIGMIAFVLTFVLGAQVQARETRVIKDETREVEVILKGNLSCKMINESTGYVDQWRPMVYLKVHRSPGAIFSHKEFSSNGYWPVPHSSCLPIEEMASEGGVHMAQQRVYVQLVIFTDRKGQVVRQIYEVVTLTINGLVLQSRQSQRIESKSGFTWGDQWKWRDSNLPCGPYTHRQCSAYESPYEYESPYYENPYPTFCGPYSNNRPCKSPYYDGP